jgi:tetratricopeptide (TPR) repeat protein
MWKAKILMLFYVLMGLSLRAQAPQQVQGLLPIPGPYLVGYAVQHHADPSRTYGDLVDATGRPLARPIQASIWYPAEAAKNPEFITFGDYVDSLTTEVTFPQATGIRKQQFLDGLKLQAFGPEGGITADWARLDRCLATPTLAIREARPAAGRFPLIVYEPSVGSVAFENSVLCEFLASHGYVVVATPSSGFSARLSPRGALDVETLIRDCEFAMEKTRALPYVDPTRTGVLGYSWGGTVSQFLAARNATIQARVAMDGAELAAGLDENVRKTFPFFDLVKTTRTPSLVIFDGGPGRPLDLDVYDRTKYADTTLLRLASVNHLNFSYLGKLQLMCREIAHEAEIQNFDRNYSAIGSYILNFLEARLRGDGQGQAFLDKTPEANGFGGLLTIEVRKGIPRPPMGETFMEIVRKEGGRKARKILSDARKDSPGVTLIDDMSLWALGQEHYLRGRPKEALEVFELWEEASDAAGPAWMKNRIYEALGKTHLKLGDSERARKYLEQALEGNPNNAYAKETLGRLAR